jgi:hypothetical protein
MKKLFLVMIAVLSCSVMEASPAEKVEVLSSKVILQNTNGYFGLSDGSCWKVVGFAPRWRSLSEWWNNVQIVPESYKCVPNDWHLNSQIEVYSKYQNLQVNEADASNQAALQQCTHLLVNSRTGQVLFAIALHPADCLVQLSTEVRKEAFDEGYHQGRLKSYANATEVYNNGHAEGYKEGYAEGVRKALNMEQQQKK